MWTVDHGDFTVRLQPELMRVEVGRGQTIHDLLAHEREMVKF